VGLKGDFKCEDEQMETVSVFIAGFTPDCVQQVVSTLMITMTHLTESPAGPQSFSNTDDPVQIKLCTLQ